jgi:hypothetical protein
MPSTGHLSMPGRRSCSPASAGLGTGAHHPVCRSPSVELLPFAVRNPSATWSTRRRPRRGGRLPETARSPGRGRPAPKRPVDSAIRAGRQAPVWQNQLARPSMICVRLKAPFARSQWVCAAANPPRKRGALQIRYAPS